MKKSLDKDLERNKLLETFRKTSSVWLEWERDSRAQSGGTCRDGSVQKVSSEAMQEKGGELEAAPG